MIRIKKLRKTLGYTQEKLAKQLNVSRTTVAMWETGGREPDYDTLVKITEIFNIPADYIIGAGIFKQWEDIIKNYDDILFELMKLIPRGLELPSFSGEKTLVAWLDQQMYKPTDELQLIRWFAFAIKSIELVDQKGGDSPQIKIDFTPEFAAIIKAYKPAPLRIVTVQQGLEEFIARHLNSAGSKLAPPEKPKFVRIPVLGDVAAGIPIEAIQDIVDYEEIAPAMAKTGEFFGLRIKGASMEPRMRDGDVVIVRKQDTAETGDTVVVLVNGDSATVKKIKAGPDGISLIPTNPAYDPIFYTAAEVESLPVRIIGRVVELRAKY